MAHCPYTGDELENLLSDHVIKMLWTSTEVIGLHKQRQTERDDHVISQH